LGLALGGGFTRGAAHIGVLKVLEEAGIKPAAVAGTSAGSIVAALYASGWTVQEMEQFSRGLSPRELIDDRLTAKLWRLLIHEVRHRLGKTRAGGPLGVLSGHRLTAFLEKLFDTRRFDDLKLPLIVTATDLVSGRRMLFMPTSLCRDEFVRLAGVPVVLAIRASCTVPGLFEPVRLGKFLLVDGAIREAIPAEAVRLPGIEAVVAVDVGGRTEERQPLERFSELVTEAWELAVSEGKRKELEAFADVVIEPVLKKAPPWDFSRVSQYIRAGEEATRAKLAEIRRVLELDGPSKPDVSSSVSKAPVVIIPASVRNGGRDLNRRA
jgi:NTE family protein